MFAASVKQMMGLALVPLRLYPLGLAGAVALAWGFGKLGNSRGHKRSGTQFTVGLDGWGCAIQGIDFRENVAKIYRRTHNIKSDQPAARTSAIKSSYSLPISFSHYQWLLCQSVNNCAISAPVRFVARDAAPQEGPPTDILGDNPLGALVGGLAGTLTDSS
ncbi:hypothetical protein HOY80DRAFT_1027775 [Tuber brumale]|nr:hypothetical protein HOY80DRAFT_1027775 [Tuber brumale]